MCDCTALHSCIRVNYVEAMLCEGPFDPREASARREVMISALWTVRSLLVDYDFAQTAFKERGSLAIMMEVRRKLTDLLVVHEAGGMRNGYAGGRDGHGRLRQWKWWRELSNREDNMEG